MEKFGADANEENSNHLKTWQVSNETKIAAQWQQFDRGKWY